MKRSWLRITIRSAQAFLLAVCLVFSLGATDPGTRFNNLGHKLMCTCGCGQVLLECNHVGCTASEGMRNELLASLNRGNNDDLVLQTFVQKYGPTVLAAPTNSGFNKVAWIMPFAVLLLAILGTSLLVRKWKLRTASIPAPANVINFEAVRDRIRRETDFTGGPRL
jgi:cytochrome c-type biogenesis protein CcmH/NrfF